MFKGGRWRSGKNKIKAVFKLEFSATKVTKLGWEAAVVSLVPADVGKPTARSERVTVMDGNCQWRKPIYETVKFNQDPKTGKINDKLYNFIVSATGSTKATVIGEITINLSEYTEVLKPSTVSLPLKGPDSGPILHVTIQRVKTDLQRDAHENGDACVREHKRKISRQENNNDEEEGSKTLGTNSNLMDDGSFTIYKSSEMKFPSSKQIRTFSGFNRNLKNSSSTDTTSVLSSERSSKQCDGYQSSTSQNRYHSADTTAEENGMKNHRNNKDCDSYQSSISQNRTCKSVNLVSSCTDNQRSFSVASGPEGSTDGSTNSLVETGPGERIQCSELDLLTLQTQMVKETENGRDLTRELSRIKEGRDGFKRQREEFKRLNDRTRSSMSHFDGEDPWSILEEIKQELIHEKNLNANLRLQLEKTKESNSELILAVEDLERVLEQKNSDDQSGSRFRNSDLHVYDCEQEQLETGSEKDSEQYALEELVKGHRHLKGAYSLEQQITGLQSEIELYKKDCEDLEMQMEQLALDYEILKQENHGITSKLEQSRLREQLRMQYECATYSTLITDLEGCVRNLENKIEEQAEVFEADLLALTHAKIQQEQRAIQAEEALRKTRWINASTVELLQGEFERLSAQMSSTFQTNEKLALQTLAEASELRLQKCHLEESLKETRKELESVQDQCHARVQELSNLISSQRRETDKLNVDLKEKSKEIQNLTSYTEEREKAFSEEILILKAEVEKLSRENLVVSEELEKKQKLISELELMNESAKESEMLLQDRNFERETLKEELNSMREAAEKSMKELYDLQNLRDKKSMNSEVASLKAQCDKLKNFLFENEVEKENLKKQIFQLRGDLQKKEDAITSMEKELKDSNAQLASYSETTRATIKNKNNTHNPAPRVTKKVANLHEKIKPLEGKLKLKDVNAAEAKNSFSVKANKTEELQKNASEYKTGVCRDTTQKNNALNGQNGDMPEDERNTSIKVNKLDGSKSQEAKSVNKQLHGGNVELAISTAGTSLEHIKEYLISNKLNQDGDVEALSKMVAIREKNEAMEAELTEMQERYSAISLKFAEVEGERQQLVMTIRALKNASKN